MGYMHFILPIHKQTNILTISTFQFIFLQHQVLMTKPLPNLFIHSLHKIFSQLPLPHTNSNKTSRSQPHIFPRMLYLPYCLCVTPSTPPPSPSTPVVGVEKSRVSTRDLFFPFLGFL